MRIRYKYTPYKKGIKLSQIKCPTCKSKHINWIKQVQDLSWNGKVVLLAECWSGSSFKDKSSHLFYIRINQDTLPIVDIDKVKEKRSEEKE